MKSIISILVISSILLFSNGELFAQKKSKKEKQVEQFTEIQKLIDSKQFIFVAERAFPQSGRSIDLTTNYGFIKIMDTETTGDLPFFGRGYTIPYGGDGGIKFDTTKIENEKFELNEKKIRILYSFEAKSKDDVYRITMDIGYSGSTSVNVSSNNRSFISYNGQVSEIKKDKDE